MEYWSDGVMGEFVIRLIHFVNPLLQYSITPLFQYSIFLDMARQTVIRHFVLRMAIHTPIHGHLHPRLRRGSFALTNISMAGRTGYLP